MTEPAQFESQFWQADDPDVRATRAAYVAGIYALAPGLTEPANRVLERLARPNWVMEWYLPRWLAETLRLNEHERRSLMLSNIYGLAYVRLQDDLADGETDGLSRAVLAPLCTALYALWTGEYLERFGANPLFWDRFRQYLSQWIGASLEEGAAASTHPEPLSPEALTRLAQRGAPLKICCAGAAILANRHALIGDFETATDHLLAAAVLLDHAADWSVDLEAGRYNAFVAHASPLPQTGANAEENRRHVREELYLGAHARPYFAIIREEIRAADRLALSIECSGLHAFLQWLDGETVRVGDRLAADVSMHLRAAAAQLFGIETDEPVPD